MAKAKTAANTVGYGELKAEIREGQCRNLYVLYGEETFLIDKLVESITNLLTRPESLALDRVVLNIGGQASRLDPDRLQAEIMTSPFISRRRLVIVRQSGWLSGVSRPAGTADTETDTDEDYADAEGIAEAQSGNISSSTQKSRQELLAKILENLPDSVCLVMIEQKVDRRLKQLINVIEKKGVLAEIGTEQPRTLKLWVEAECRRRGLSVDDAAAESLIDRCDGSMMILWQEMNKLFLYCAFADCRRVDLSLIAEISLPDLRGNIFDLTDALSEGKTERAMVLVDTLISQKQPVQLIQFMLARHIRQLICAAELGRPDRIASELKVMPFVAARLANQSRRLSITLLEDLYARCFETDMLVKTGQLGDRLALETLLISAAGLAGKTTKH